MSIKNVITNNGIASASFNGKNYSRREVNGVVFYDITSSSSGATSGGTGGLGAFIDQQSITTGTQLKNGSFPDYDPDTQVIFAQVSSNYSTVLGFASRLLELQVGSTTLYVGGHQQSQVFITFQADGTFSVQGQDTHDFTFTRFTRANVDGSSSSSSGGANVTTSDTMPASASNGDLWYDETNGGLYVYTDSINGWIQTNGGGGDSGGSGTGGFIDQQTAYTGAYSSIRPRSGSFSDFDPDTQIVFAQAEHFSDTSSTIGGGSTNTIELLSDGTNNILFLNNHTITVVLQSDGSFTCSESLSYPTKIKLTRFTRANLNGGGGSGTGPRAYVAFDGTASNMTNELSASNSFNVSSITDHQAGQYTVTFASPVPNPVASLTNKNIIFNSSPISNNSFPYLQSDFYAVGSDSITIGLRSNADSLWYDSTYISLIVF